MKLRDLEDKFHGIDKSLTTLTALFYEKAKADNKAHEAVAADVKEIKRSLESLKIRVAGQAAGVAVITFLVGEFVFKLVQAKLGM